MSLLPRSHAVSGCATTSRASTSSSATLTCRRWVRHAVDRHHPTAYSTSMGARYLLLLCLHVCDCRVVSGSERGPRGQQLAGVQHGGQLRLQEGLVSSA